MIIPTVASIVPAIRFTSCNQTGADTALATIAVSVMLLSIYLTAVIVNVGAAKVLAALPFQ